MSENMGKKNEVILFGGEKGWNTSDWTASDDRVRGGKSQSYLDISDSEARFHGNLDIKTLGGAGFASQRTTGEDRSWDLSNYDGIKIDLGKADSKRYTFILKDELLPKSPNGREQSTISYEYDFSLSESEGIAESSFIIFRWEDLVPTFRGKEKKDAKKLNVKSVKRVSIMMRSFFGDQEGDFSLGIKSIRALSIPKDLEKGSDDKTKLSVSSAGHFFNASTLRRALAVGLGLCGVCLLMYPWCRTYMA